LKARGKEVERPALTAFMAGDKMTGPQKQVFLPPSAPLYGGREVCHPTGSVRVIFQIHFRSI
jgi:hypothetical protein